MTGARGTALAGLERIAKEELERLAAAPSAAGDVTWLRRLADDLRKGNAK